jgi:hypothetical protein
MSLIVKDARGSLQELPNKGTDPTYRAVYSVAAASVVNGHDVLAISLAASPTVHLKVKGFRVALLGDGTHATTAPITVKIVKRSALDTGGTTGTAPTKVPAYAGNPATQATIVVYTANPTDGAAVGTLAERALSIDAQVTDLANPVRVTDSVDIDLTEGGTCQPPTLSTAVEQIGVVMGAALPTGSTLVIETVWSEAQPGTFL